MEEFLEIINFLKTNKCKRIGIFTHHNADPDAIASAIGLKFLLNEIMQKVEVSLFASSVSSLSTGILENLDEKFNQELNNHDFEAIFLCDTNNMIQLGSIDIQPLIAKKTPIFIIDHHSDHEFIKKSRKTIIKSITSTSEIISLIFQDLKLKPSKELATLLISGIVFDTRRFIYFSDMTFLTIQFLINSGGDYNKALLSLKSKISLSERIARLKGAQRLLIHRDEEFVIVVTQVNSFESSVARALIELGSELVAVLAKASKLEYRISLRCTKRYAQDKEINLGTVANYIAVKIGGTGGGHQTAAGINFTNIDFFPKEMEECLQFILNILLDAVNSQKIFE